MRVGHVLAEIADVVAFVMPKALTSGLSYERARESLRAYALPEFIDFGEAAFSGIGIETVGIVVSTQKSPGMMRVTSDVLGQSRHLQQSYVVDQTFPTWLPYRNDEFDAFAEKFSLGMVRGGQRTAGLAPGKRQALGRCLLLEDVRSREPPVS